MGSLFSSSLKSSAEEAGGDDTASASLVLGFHTVDSWNAHWESHKKSDKLMVIDFKASWCGPCRFVEPAVKALAGKFTDVVFAKIDVDELPEVSAKWNVEAMPTFVLVKGEKEVGRVIGARKDELEAKIVSCLKL